MAVESKSLKPFFLRTYRFNNVTKEELEEYVKILRRNNRTAGEDIESYIKDTVKNHTTGNDQYKLDQWNDNIDMRAVPAFNSTDETWDNYVVKGNYENFLAVKKQHEKLGNILSKTKFTMGKIGLTIQEMGFTPDVIDKTCLEKSEEAYNKLCHEDNMKFFKKNSKQEYLNKIGVEAYQ